VGSETGFPFPAEFVGNEAVSNGQIVSKALEILQKKQTLSIERLF
jgi:hypothetical protein